MILGAVISISGICAIGAYKESKKQDEELRNLVDRMILEEFIVRREQKQYQAYEEILRNHPLSWLRKHMD